jgi:hypothetical protein
MSVGIFLEKESELWNVILDLDSITHTPYLSLHKNPLISDPVPRRSSDPVPPAVLFGTTKNRLKAVFIYARNSSTSA